MKEPEEATESILQAALVAQGDEEVEHLRLRQPGDVTPAGGLLTAPGPSEKEWKSHKGTKAQRRLKTTSPAHKKQLLTYLKLTGLKLGLLFNLGNGFMKDGITRTINGQLDK